MKQLLILIAYLLNGILRLKSSNFFRQTIQIPCSEQLSRFGQELLEPNGGVRWNVPSYLALIHQTACSDQRDFPLRRRRHGVHGVRRGTYRRPPPSSPSDRTDLRDCSSSTAKT